MSSQVDVLGWLEDPPARPRTIHVADSSRTWRRFSYEELARLACRMASGLRAAGVRRNDVILIVTAQGPRFIGALFGSMLAGATPSPVAPPRVFSTEADYDEHFVHVVETAAPRMILTSPKLASRLSSIAGSSVQVVTAEEIEAGAGSHTVAAGATRADVALLQFTSGSSGKVRGVPVTFGALAANVSAIHRWLDWTCDDAAAFWIPHYHDMGLVGGLFAPLASHCDLMLLTTNQFVRRPLEYLRCLGESGARLTALPAFGLDYMTRRVRPEDLRGLEFSHVKGIVVGAEPIDPATLRDFCERLEPFGLRPGSLLPAYGLAEATLAVTALPPGERWTTRAPNSGGPPVVGCGPPLRGVECMIVDENRQVVPEGDVGEIVVRGTSLSSGNRETRPSDARASVDVGLRTGDAGFCLGNQLFPIGRLGDSIKIRGRSLFAEQIERELHQQGHSRTHNAVVLGMRAGRPTLVWFSTRAFPAESSETLKTLSRLTEGADIVLVGGDSYPIPRTSSGKPRRRVLWNAFVDGRISCSVRDTS